MDKVKYSIKAVSKLTGLSAHTIRAWERRYEVVNPGRTSSNRRYYSEDDIQKLKLLSQATAEGFNIGNIASLPLERLYETIGGKDYQAARMNSQVVSKISHAGSIRLVSGYLEQCLDSIIKFQSVDFENILQKASVELDHDELINNLIIPLIYEIGERWFNGSLRIAHEHMASSVLIGFLQKLRSVYSYFQDKPVVICGTPKGQFHELGALLVSVIAASEGYRVIYLGANIPVDEITSAAKNLCARVICLSLVYPENDVTVKQYLADLRNMPDKDISVIIGGRAALSYRDVIEKEGFILAKDIHHFKKVLVSFRDPESDNLV